MFPSCGRAPNKNTLFRIPLLKQKMVSIVFQECEVLFFLSASSSNDSSSFSNGMDRCMDRCCVSVASQMICGAAFRFSGIFAPGSGNQQHRWSPRF